MHAEVAVKLLLRAVSMQSSLSLRTSAIICCVRKDWCSCVCLLQFLVALAAAWRLRQIYFLRVCEKVAKQALYI